MAEVLGSEDPELSRSNELEFSQSHNEGAEFHRSNRWTTNGMIVSGAVILGLGAAELFNGGIVEAFIAGALGGAALFGGLSSSKDDMDGAIDQAHESGFWEGYYAHNHLGEDRLDIARKVGSIGLFKAKEQYDSVISGIEPDPGTFRRVIDRIRIERAKVVALKAGLTLNGNGEVAMPYMAQPPIAEASSD